MTRWKVIIAADGPWSGEVYQTRSGSDRSRFGSVVGLCSAFMATTGWSLQAVEVTAPGDATHGVGPRPSHPCGRRFGRGTTKIVVAADEPWRGAVYTTTGASRERLWFTGFEEFLRAVVDVSGWSVGGSAAAPSSLRPPPSASA